MKSLFTTVLFAFTTILAAQTVAFEPATSIMDDNAVASVDEMFFAEEAEAMIEVDNEFNLEFITDAYFGDIVISYDLNGDADVKLEVEKVGTETFALINETQSTGTQQVLWDQNIGAGTYTIRLIVNNKVETKTINLTF